MMRLRLGRYLARVAAPAPDYATAPGFARAPGFAVAPDFAPAPDFALAAALRGLCFGKAAGQGGGAADCDDFDARCTHILIEDALTADLVCCFRILPLDALHIQTSYSAQFYDLAALAQFGGPVLELGRFCVHPDHSDPDILRLAWAWLTRWVDARGVRLLFGCTSFAGNNAGPHLDAFARLYGGHQAPPMWRPRPKAAQIFDFATGLADHRPDARRGVAGLPPLLRSYLLMGGWVSDHAVYDHDLGTMHVFTGVEIARIPAPRARLLRSLAGQEPVTG